MKIIRPYCLLIGGLLLLVMGIFCLTYEFLLPEPNSSLNIENYLAWLFSILLGIFLLKNKYCYTDKYFMHCIFKNGIQIPFEKIEKISNNSVIGFFYIQTNNKTYHLPLLFQKKELQIFSEFVKKVNKDCCITID